MKKEIIIKTCYLLGLMVVFILLVKLGVDQGKVIGAQEVCYAMGEKPMVRNVDREIVCVTEEDLWNYIDPLQNPTMKSFNFSIIEHE